MKKALLVLVIFVIFAAGCGYNKNKTADVTGKPPAAAAAAVYEIKEGMFLTQTNDIYLNHKDYLGKTIKLEGFFKPTEWQGEQHYYIIRKAPGCCGDDGEIGFEITWDSSYRGLDDGARRELYPKNDEWIEISGKLSTYEKRNMTFLYLALSDLNILEKRGAEYVSR